MCSSIQTPTFDECIWLSSDLNLFIPSRPPTNPSSFFLFCPDEENDVLLVLIPRPVERLTLLLVLSLRLLVLELRLDFASLSIQNALLENFRGAPNFMASSQISLTRIFFLDSWSFPCTLSLFATRSACPPSRSSHPVQRCTYHSHHA